jgi:hypothetical protein
LHLTQEPKTKENIGFQIDVSLISKPEATDQKNLKIHIKRNLLESAAGGNIQIISQDFSESFVLQNQQMVALGGLLPRKAITDVAEAAIYDSNTLLRTLVDPQFLKFEKEFLILIKL